ncbi:hypothetical protein [Bacillus sp. JJ1562]|uniref:hypothetical protein n=1 Tax=Bacillus sp. JJ1562 TaxID=3122960 RepID=UPI003002C069
MDLNKFKYYMNLLGLTFLVAITYLHIFASFTNQVTLVGAGSFTFSWIITFLYNDVFWEYINKWMGK